MFREVLVRTAWGQGVSPRVLEISTVENTDRIVIRSRKPGPRGFLLDTSATSTIRQPNCSVTLQRSHTRPETHPTARLGPSAPECPDT